MSGFGDIYSEGEPVDVNCTSARSKPAASLSWYINDEEVSYFIDCKPPLNIVAYI
jgi:hypothetical protein